MLKWKIKIELTDDEDNDMAAIERQSQWNFENCSASAFWCLGQDIGFCVDAISDIVPDRRCEELLEGITDCLRDKDDRWLEKNIQNSKKVAE